MSILVLLGAGTLCMAAVLVAQGIHIRTAAPAQRRGARLLFGYMCLQLALVLGIWWWIFQLSTLEAIPDFPGWTLACVVPPLIMIGAGAVGALVHEVRQAGVRPTTSMDLPPEA